MLLGHTTQSSNPLISMTLPVRLSKTLIFKKKKKVRNPNHRDEFLSPSVSHGCTDVKSHDCILTLLTFVWRCFSVDGFEFEPIISTPWWMSVCEKLVGGLALTSSGLLTAAETQKYVGDLGWMGDTHTRTQLVRTGRGMLATLLPSLVLVSSKWVLPNLDVHPS